LRLAKGKKKSKKQVSDDKRKGEILIEFGNLLEKIGKRIIICIFKALGITSKLLPVLLDKSDHKIYLNRERNSWIERQLLEGNTTLPCQYCYGLLGLMLKSFVKDGLQIHSDSGTFKDEFRFDTYELMPIDSKLEEFDVLVLPGKTLETITASYIEATAYNHEFSQESNEDHKYIEFFLEAQNGTTIDCRKVLQKSIITNIPEAYQRPIPVINDYSQTTHFTNRVKKFNPETTFKPFVEFATNITQLPGFLIKRGIFGEDSESE